MGSSTNEQIAVLEHRISSCGRWCDSCKCDKAELRQLYRHREQELGADKFVPRRPNGGERSIITANEYRNFYVFDNFHLEPATGKIFSDEDCEVEATDEEVEHVQRLIAEEKEIARSWKRHREALAEGREALLFIFELAQAYQGDGQIVDPILRMIPHPDGHKVHGRFWGVGRNSSHEFKLGLDEHGEMWRLSIDCSEEDMTYRYTQVTPDNIGYIGHH